MATINLGRVKLVNRGTWSSANTYAIDDFVQFTDNGVVSTYIAVAASTNQTPSTSGTENSNFWKFLARGVTDPISGLGNNKIVTTNSSGNATAVAIGTAGQFLRTNSGANGFEFATVQGGLIRTEQTHKTNVHQRTSSSFGDIPDLTLSFAPASASHKVLLMCSAMGEMSSGNDSYYTFARDGNNLGNNNGFSNKQGESIRHTLHFSFLDQPNTTSTVSYTVQHRVNGGTSSFNNGSVKANFIALEVAV